MAKRLITTQIDSELWKKVKKHCAIKGVYISDYIGSLVVEDIKKNEK